MSTFIGEVRDPYCSPTITKGLVEFVVHPLQGGILQHNRAQLVSISGEVYPVAVRGTGRVHPGPSVQQRWNPEDFLVRLDGIAIEQAQNMQKIIQEYVAENTPFIGEIIEAPSSSESGLVKLRVRPQPYASVTLKEAQLVAQSGETISVVLRRVEAAPASPTLGQFGDLIISVEGITLEQAKFVHKLVQPQDK